MTCFLPGLFRARVLGDGLGTFADGVLGQLAGQKEADGRLDLPAGDRGTLVVVGEAGGLRRYALEYVVDEAVHDAHRLAGDTGVGVDLLQHLVNVDGVALLPSAFLLLVALGDVLLRLSGLLGGFTASLGWHRFVYSLTLLTDSDSTAQWCATAANRMDPVPGFSLAFMLLTFRRAAPPLRSHRRSGARHWRTSDGIKP